MIKFIVLFLFSFLSLIFNVSAEEVEQNLSDFNLSGFSDKGRKSWEIVGKSADIYAQIVRINNLNARFFRDDEDIELQAKEADFNKTNGYLTLRKDVLITTTKGAMLTTDMLEWNRNQQIISTKDRVDIQRDNIIASALGAFASLDLKKINLEKDVSVQIGSQSTEALFDKSSKDKIIITCDGPMEIDYDKNIAIFNNNVKIVKEDIQICSDRVEVYFLKGSIKINPSAEAENQIEKIHAFGNVRIIKDENVSFSQEAIYVPKDKKIVLNGKPRLIIYPDEGGWGAASRD
ncbi:MAG: LPS export ABC transporter periplasmic protein LptC [Candidatus Omnitrophica bacterium]|nr:LPS export ABC transporter periplasmic protein LptC [Candidatus Omnitrophota bacterium]